MLAVQWGRGKDTLSNIGDQASLFIFVRGRILLPSSNAPSSKLKCAINAISKENAWKFAGSCFRVGDMFDRHGVLMGFFFHRNLCADLKVYLVHGIQIWLYWEQFFRDQRLEKVSLQVTKHQNERITECLQKYWINKELYKPGETCVVSDSHWIERSTCGARTQQLWLSPCAVRDVHWTGGFWVALRLSVHRHYFPCLILHSTNTVEVSLVYYCTDGKRIRTGYGEQRLGKHEPWRGTDKRTMSRGSS